MLFNNAGVLLDESPFKKAAVRTTRELFEDTFAVNVIGTASLTDLLLPLHRVRDQHQGNICRRYQPWYALVFRRLQGLRCEQGSGRHADLKLLAHTGGCRRTRERCVKTHTQPTKDVDWSSQLRLVRTWQGNPAGDTSGHCLGPSRRLVW